MSTLYDKNYELPKECYGLTRPVYIVVTARLRAYPDYKNRIAHINNMSDTNITEEDLINKASMQAIVTAVENGLNWVSDELKPPIWKYAINHYKNGLTWEDVAEEFHYSSSHLRLNYMKFIYGVAYELGEII